MKTTFFLCGMLLLGSASFAQELVSKKGEPYLPQEKEWGLQLDATPFLDYAGKLLSNAGATSPVISGTSGLPFTITGKYFKTAQFAWRGRVRIGSTSTTARNVVIDNANSQTDTVYTSDSRSIRNTNLNLSFGFERRRGKTRLQGFYGAEAMLMVQSGSTSYDYGNAFSSTQTVVTTTDFNLPLPGGGFASSTRSSRLSEVKQGNTFGLGARGFVGAEYFILPKLSLAAELGWTIMFTTQNDGYTVTESWDNANSRPRIRQVNRGGGSSFGVDTDNIGGSLALGFYF